MEDTLWSIGETSKFIGVSEKTLRTWDQKGILPASKTDGGHRRYEPDTVRAFIKQGNLDSMKTITDEFIEADVRTKVNQAEKDSLFWDARGYLPAATDKNKTERTVLATILSNQMDYMNSNYTCNVSQESVVDDEFFLKVVRKLWDHLTCRQFINVGAMNGPTSLDYYLGYTDDGCTRVEQMVISSKSSKLKSQILIPEKRRSLVTVLDPKTFTPTERQVTNPIAYHNDLDTDWLADYNARQIADELNDEVVYDLWENAESVSKPFELVLRHKYPYNYIITNEVGVKLLEKHADIKLEAFTPSQSTQLIGEAKGGLKIYHKNNIEGMLFGHTPPSFMNALYSYYIYIPIICTPTTFSNAGIKTSTGIIMRGCKTFRPGNHTNYKVIF